MICLSEIRIRLEDTVTYRFSVGTISVICCAVGIPLSAESRFEISHTSQRLYLFLGIQALLEQIGV